MLRVFQIVIVFLLALPLFAQGKRLWVLRDPGEMVEYDPTTFAGKKRVKVPGQALKNPANLSVSGGASFLLPQPPPPAVTEEDAAAPQTIWFTERFAGF